MSYGFKSINDANTILIDDTYQATDLFFESTVLLSGPQTSVVVPSPGINLQTDRNFVASIKYESSTYFVRVSAFLSDTFLIRIFDLTSQIEFPELLPNALDRTVTIRLYKFVTPTAGDFGMIIFDSLSVPVFNSDSVPLKISETTSLSVLAAGNPAGVQYNSATFLNSYSTTPFFSFSTSNLKRYSTGGNSNSWTWALRINNNRLEGLPVVWTSVLGPTAPRDDIFPVPIQFAIST